MAGKLKHRTQSTVVDEGVAGEIGPNEWNDSEVASEGSEGDVFTRRTGQADGWAWEKLGAAPAWVNTVDANNSGTGETDLHTFTIPASHFNVTGRSIRISGIVAFAANANTKTLKLKFGAVSVTLNPTQTAPNGLNAHFEYIITRTGSNTQKVVGRVLLGAAIEVITATGTGAETETGAITLKTTGQSGTGSNDVTAKYTQVEYLG